MIKYVYKIIRNVLKTIVCNILFRVRYENLEILENYEKCMICPNHSRVFDPIFLYPKIENMYSVAKSDLFKNKLVAHFLRYHNTIPIKRDATDVGGTKKIMYTLKAISKIRLLIFPEGGIFKENYAGNKRGTKNGAMYIAAMANVPIIPVYITSRPNFFSKVTIHFGEPYFPNLKVLKDRKILREEAKKLIHYIYELEEKNVRDKFD